jgi:uncharacterized membrane protein YphA (DoxX/SURF4 family)
MITDHKRLDSLWWVLRLTYGVVPIVAGLDKFFNVLTNWEQYLNPMAARFLPISASAFMQGVGIIEIAAGIIVLSRFTTLGAYVISAWLTLIAISLLVSGHYLDVAVRDLVMAVGAYSLGVLSEVLAERRSQASSYEPALARPATI